MNEGQTPDEKGEDLTAEEEWDIGLSDEDADEFESILDEIDLEKLAKEAEEEEKG